MIARGTWPLEIGCPHTTRLGPGRLAGSFETRATDNDLVTTNRSAAAAAAAAAARARQARFMLPHCGRSVEEIHAG